MATQMWERSSGRFVAIVAAVLILSAVVPGAGAVLSTPTSSPAQLASGPVHQQGVETDSVRLIVSVQPDGSANWTVQYWTRLDDGNTTDAFESLQSDIEANPSNYSDRFATRMRSTVSSAENATGREMSASGFGVRAETRTPPQYGVVIYTFQWDGFAAVEDDTIRIGDAIEGIFLDDRTRLVIEWPNGYTPAEVQPEPDERRSEAVVWRGAETSFVSGEPSVVLQPSTAGTTAAGGNGGGGTATPPADGDGSSLPLLGAGIAVALLVAAAWTYRGRFRGERSQGTGAPPAEDQGQTTATEGETAAEPVGESATAREDLLSNEERVVQFVRDQGGRVKQQEIVEAFDWTEARTSQIVRDLREEGELEGFRLGRENVLKLPDEDERPD